MRKPKGKRRARNIAHLPVRKTDYRVLRHPFQPQKLFSDDEINTIHETALKILEQLGLRILSPSARELFKRNGASVDDDMVFLGRDIVAAALGSAPTAIQIRSINPARELIYENGAMLFLAGAGCPNATDAQRGRRAGNLDTYIETLKLQQSFDVIHMLGPCVEPQDVPVQYRHYAMMQAQMQYADKTVSIFSRGQKQVAQSLEMIQLGFALSTEEFNQGVWATTVINSNSPRLLDVPMAEGIMDFAKAGQMSIITPFCLAGAMAPITVAGALTLQHAEALACITLAQLTRAGAPVSYGGFSSNVDMKSGSPAFGTPEHLQMLIGGGQLARHIGLPWRSASGTSSNVADAQGATETINGLWGSLMANTTLTIHAAGWLEGGLTFGYEKFINDVEALQVIAELCNKPDGSDTEIGFDAIAEVAPAGHFFETQHTKDRYRTAFYEPLVAQTTNFGAWTENGAQTSAERAVAIWERTLTQYQAPESGAEVAQRLSDYIEKAKAAGGAPPID